MIFHLKGRRSEKVKDGRSKKRQCPGVMSGGAEESVRKQVRGRLHEGKKQAGRHPWNFAHLKPFVTLAKAVSME